jgi:ATP-dependent DNA helicase RecG
VVDASAIEELIRLGEDATTEFKGMARGDTKVDPRDLAKAIVSLANTKGGCLVLGIEDDGAVTGVGSPKEADGLMLQAVQTCRPSTLPSGARSTSVRSEAPY